MFERFTPDAREAVVQAQDEARTLRHGWIGTEHLLIGVLRQGDSVGAKVLGGFGLTLEGARADVRRIIGEGPGEALDDQDAEALRAIGIDLDDVRRAVEGAFGPGALDRSPTGPRRIRRGCPEPGPGPFGHVPFTSRAKKTLELALREAVHLRQENIGTEHVVLGIAREGDGVGAMILTAHGIAPAELRAAVARGLGGDGPPPEPTPA
jgi:ATP-dependent Clp protease ATP-binding subunit ClpA